MRRTIILGAAGGDFFDFLTVYRDRPDVEVVAFTAQQIPYIAERRFRAELAGERYPEGIPIHAEAELERVIREKGPDTCVLAYSDPSALEVLRLAARANAAGADFIMPGARQVLRSRRPVIAVTASRTGAGKSPLSRAIVPWLRSRGLRLR